MPSLSLIVVIALVLAAFVPAIIFVLIVKNTERWGREPTRRVMLAFLRGATLSVFLALLLEILLIHFVFDMDILRVSDILGSSPELRILVLACIIAPFVEELTKALGILPHSRRARELEDGIVYGAAVGLGFAATENLFYESAAYAAGGLSLWIGTIVVRTISSALLHASASSIAGYGLTKRRLLGSSWLPYYLGAVILHAIFNLAASAGLLLQGQLGDSAFLLGLATAVAIAVGAFSWSRRKIRSIEARRWSS